MEFDKNLLGKEEENESNLDFKEQIEKYLRYWKWFALALLITFIYTFFSLNFTRSSYTAESTVKIKDEKNGERSTLSAFQDLGIMPNAKDNIEDEIEILKSKYLISESIKDLGLNIAQYTDKNGISFFLDHNLGFSTEFYEKENYEHPPLKLNFFMPDSAVYNLSTQFLIQINSPTQFVYEDIETGVTKTNDFGKKMTTNFGELIILPNIDLKKNDLIGKKVMVSLSPVSDMALNYQEDLTIEPKAEFSSVLSLSVTSSQRKKAADFLNALVENYNERAINMKRELSESTSNFVTERLQIISDELSQADEQAEDVKSKFGASDFASSAGINYQAGREIEKQITQTGTQLQQIRAVKNLINSQSNEVIPNIGIPDAGVSSNVEKLNELILEKMSRLEAGATEKNPIIVNLQEQISTLQNTVRQGLNSVENSQKIALDNYNNQYNIATSRIYGASTQERQIRDVTRQQQIKEQLFLYLLQKREETAITLGVADPNAIIIDKAETLPKPAGPNKKIAYLVAILVGLIIPFAIIYVKDLLDSKIHTREDVEKVVNIPIIGDIPKLETGTRYSLNKGDYSAIAEAFRILRTNLSFILPKTKDNRGKVIFVTSTVAHEGKSLVSSNLATALAHANKKTIILGMDIRAPKLEPYLGDRGKLGLTNYIINSDYEPKDIIVSSKKTENLDIVSSGDIAPNPAELLMNERVGKLIDYAKENYEYVIVDTAAFSMVTDTLLLSKFSDAFIYVVRANFLDKRMLRYVNFLHKERRLPNMALLLNGVDHKKSYGYGYGYGYGYASKKSGDKKPWWKFG
ncbi:MAG: tyrosine protein kinase [Flavobacteriales bacterium]|nr:MAG: tyrosine protein kinase [Flavobacteriales bacterium]